MALRIMVISVLQYLVSAQGPLSSYFICIEESKNQNVITNSVTCQLACISFDDVCFCLQDKSWSIKDNFFKESYTCDNVACENNLVVRNSFSSVQACPDPLRSKIFNIITWFDDAARSNFLHVTPGLDVLVSTEVHVNVLYAETNETLFTYDFGDTFIINQTSLSAASHMYSFPGVYTIKVIIQSSNFISFVAQKKIQIRIPFSKMVMNGCSAQTVVLEDQNNLFYCIGFVEGSNEIKIEMDTHENVFHHINVTASVAMSPVNGHCFYDCNSRVLKNNLGAATTIGDYVLSKHVLMYGSVIQGVEYFGVGLSTCILKIMRPDGTGGYNLINKSTFDVEVGHKVFLFADELLYNEGDVFALLIDDRSPSIQVVEDQNSSILYYQSSSGSNNLGSIPTKVIQGKTFRIQLHTISRSYVYLEHKFTLTGTHNITFTGRNKYGVVRKSNSISVKVISRNPELLKNHTTYNSYIASNKSFDICITYKNVLNPSTSWIHQSGQSNAVLAYDNGVFRSIFINNYTNNSVPIKPVSIFNHCAKLVITKVGKYVVKVVGYENSQQLDFVEVTVDVVQQFTGLTFSYTPNGSIIHQLQPVFFRAQFELYPLKLPLSFVFDFGDGHNYSAPMTNLTHTHVYIKEGNYSAQFIANYGNKRETIELNIEVNKTFFITGNSKVPVNTLAIYKLESNIPHDSSWIYSWFFYKGYPLKTVSGNPNTDGKFSTGGVYEIQCTLTTAYGTAKMNYTVIVYLPIQYVQIEIAKTSNLFTNVNITFIAVTTGGNFLSYGWDASTLNILKISGNKMVARSTVATTHVVKVNVSNVFFNYNAVNGFNLLEYYLEHFSVKPVEHYVVVGKSALFLIQTVGGGKDKFFTVNIPKDNFQDQFLTTNYTYQFVKVGFFEVIFEVALNGSYSNCILTSIVSCRYITNITVMQAIKDVTILYISNNETSDVTQMILVPSKTDLKFSFYIKNASVLYFELIVNGTSLRRIPGQSNGLDSFAIVTVSKVYFSLSRTYEFVLTAINQVSSVKKVFFVNAIHPITGLKIISNNFAEVRMPARFLAYVNSGTVKNYTWKYQDDLLSTKKEFYTTFKKAGYYNIWLSVSNEVSTMKSNLTVHVLIPISNLFLNCPNQVFLVGTNTTVAFGVLEGDLVTIFLLQNTNQSTFSCSKSPCFFSETVTFSKSGDHKVTVKARNPIGTLAVKECLLTFESVVSNVTVKLAEIGYVSDKVTIEIQHHGGTRVNGELEVFNQHNLLLNVYPLKFNACHSTKDCGIATVDHTFDISSRYYVKCFVFNEFSRVKCIPKLILITGITGSDNQLFLELIAEASRLGEAAKIHIVEKNNYKIKSCELNFGVPGMKSVFLDDKSNRTIIYNYSSIGNHKLLLSCKSPKGTVSCSANALVQRELRFLNFTTFKTNNCLSKNQGALIEIVLQHAEMMFDLVIKTWVDDSIVTPATSKNKSSIYLLFPSPNGTNNSTKIVISIRNFVSSEKKNFTFCIKQPIEVMKGQVPSYWDYTITMPFQFMIKSKTPVKFLINFGDGTAIQNSTNDLFNIYYHKYKHPGTYEYSVRGVNDFLPAKYVNGTIKVVQPLGNLSLIYEKIIIWPDRLFHLELLFHDKVLNKTDIQLRFYSGENYLHNDIRMFNLTIDETSKKVRVNSYNYSSPGCYEFSLLVQNLINSVVLKGLVTVLSTNSFSPKISNTYNLQVNTSTLKLRDDFPLYIHTVNSIKTCYLYLWEIKSRNNTSVYSGSATSGVFQIDDIIGMTGLFDIKIDLVVQRNYSNVYTIMNKTIEQRNSIPKVSLYTLTNKQELKLILLSKVNPVGISNISLQFGDGKMINLVPTFVLKNTNDPSLMNIYGLKLKASQVYIFNTSHTYTNVGLYTVKMSSVNEVSGIVLQQNILFGDDFCKRPQVQIQTPLNSGILKMLYQQDITLIPSVSANCGNNITILFVWNIFLSNAWEMNNDISSNGKKPISLNVINSKARLIMSKKTLPPGIYIVKVSVMLAEKRLDNYDEVYLIIEDEAIRAIIDRGSFLQLPWEESFTLDASSLIEFNKNYNSLNYEWKCQYLMNGIYLNCFYNDINAISFLGMKWSIDKGLLLEKIPYEFTLLVRDSGSNKVVSSMQTITLIDKKMPTIDMRCLSNCQAVVSSSTRVTIAGKCNNCLNQNDLTYQWMHINSANHQPIIFDVDTLTKNSSPNLVIRRNTLIENSSYVFGLTVTDRSGFFSYAEYSFQTHSKPYGGLCNISPSNGTVLKTLFTVSCVNWTSLYPINYRIFNVLDEDGHAELLSYGPLETMTLFLPGGKVNNDYNVNLIVEVFDAYNTITVANLSAKVLPITRDIQDINTAHTYLMTFVNEPNSTLKQSSATGNVLQFMQIANIVADTINTLQNFDEILINRTDTKHRVNVRIEMRSKLMKVVLNVGVNSKEDVKQASLIINFLLQFPKEVNMETLELISIWLLNMITFLENDKSVLGNSDPDETVDLTNVLIKATGSFLHVLYTQNIATNQTNTTSSKSVKELQQRRNFTLNALQVVDRVMSLLLNGKVAGEKSTKISGKRIILEAGRRLLKNLRSEITETINGGSFLWPAFSNHFKSISVVDTKMSSLSNNPFFWSSSNTVSSPVSSLSISTNNTDLPVKDLPPGDEVQLFIPQNVPVGQISLNRSSLNDTKLVVYKMKLMPEHTAVIAFINTSSPNTTHSFVIEVFVRKNRRPTLINYDQKIEYDGNNDTYSVLLTNENITSYYIGLKLLNGYNDTFMFDVDVVFYSTACLFWNDKNEDWQNHGCKVGHLTTRGQIHCVCDHLTWFGSSFFIPPNSLDIEKELLKLKRVEDYPALLSSFCVIIGVYLIFLVWARRKDVKETDKGEPTILKTQSSLSGTTYHMAIYTGHRGGSGTTATPSIIISGKNADSQPLLLTNETRASFKRASVETFIFNSNVNISDIRYVTIWHDDKGDSPGWFLSRIVITNLNTNKQYVCFCNDWLAVDQSDGSIMRTLPVATAKELASFENIFLARTARDLTDGHLWFSIVSRPPRSSFTRIQRLSCALSLLLTTMLSNAMFYRVAEGKPTGNEIDINGWKISWSEILIGIESSLVVLPFNILIVLLFRRAQPKNVYEMQKDEKSSSLPEDQRGEGTAYNKDNTVINTKDPLLVPSTLQPVSPEEINLEPSAHSTETANNILDEGVTKMIDVGDKKTTRGSSVRSDAVQIELPDEIKYWPYWLRYVAWVLFILVSLIAGFFTLLYGLSFGRVGQEKWLLSFFISVFADIIVYQPVKVIVLAALITVIVRKLKDEYVLTEINKFRNIAWTADEDFMDDEGRLNLISSRPPPPSKDYLKQTRKKRLYEAKLVDVILEITFYLVYLFLCLLITYGHRDPDAYQMTRTVENIFVTNKFNKLKSIPDFWVWSFDVLSKGMYEHPLYNGIKPNESGFIADGSTLLVGSARLRQLRVIKNTCLAHERFGIYDQHCGPEYDPKFEDVSYQYCATWLRCSFNLSTLYPQYWKYNVPGESGSQSFSGRLRKYSGGGYLAILGKKKSETDRVLSYLFDNHWLDDFTRALFVEFTLYNTQANFYVMVTLLLEVPATGGVLVDKNILTTRLDRYSSGFAVFLGACEIIFLSFTIYYMVRELKRMLILKWSYFSDWRNWIELIGFGCIWASFALLIVRFGVVTVVKNKYFKNRSDFVNFDNAALSDHLYGTTLSFVAFMVLLKFLKLFKFNLKMSMMVKTIMYASKELQYFTITFMVAFMSYVLWSHLVFLNDIEDYSTVTSSVEALFHLLLGKFDFYKLTNASRFFGPLIFVTFVCLMMFVMLNMFISILNDAYSFVEERTRTQKNKYEILDFLKQRLMSYLPAQFTRKKICNLLLEKKNPEVEQFQDELVENLKNKGKIAKKVHFVRDATFKMNMKYRRNLSNKIAPPNIGQENFADEKTPQSILKPTKPMQPHKKNIELKDLTNLIKVKFTMDLDIEKGLPKTCNDVRVSARKLNSSTRQRKKDKVWKEHERVGTRDDTDLCVVLEEAVEKIDAYVSFMTKEDKFHQRILEYIL